ncbi:hypothetical protein [Spirochaeta dissipatitropha]
MQHILETIHFSSWITRISLELPVGFEEQSEDEEDYSVVYADDLDPDDEPGARVLTKITAVDTESQAAGIMAEESVAVLDAQLQDRRECSIDGVPAIFQILHMHEPILKQDMLRCEAFAQLDDVLFSIVCMAPLLRQHEYFNIFEKACLGTRLMIPTTPETELPVSLTHRECGLSLLIPKNWKGYAPAKNQIQFLAPAIEELDNYQPSISFMYGQPESSGQDWFQEFCKLNREQIQKGYRNSNLLETRTFSISSMAELNIEHFEWEPEEGFEVSQLQALLMADRYRMYVIHAACRKSIADIYIPIFRDIILSMRLLPIQQED